MKPFFLVICIQWFTLCGVVSAADSSLERRIAEQERQIRNLELENSRLRSMLEKDHPELIEETSEPDRSPTATTSSPSGSTSYIVRSGDTLSRIARKHGVSATQLAKSNNLRNASLIRPGQRLVVPSAKKAASAPKLAATAAPSQPVETGTHIVRAGETFFSIARQYGVGAAALAAANPDLNPRSLQVGQKVEFPLGSSNNNVPAILQTTSTNGSGQASNTVSNKPRIRSITVDQELTFAEFSDRYKMSPEKLNALNGLSLEPRTVLAKGSELYVAANP